MIITKLAMPRRTFLRGAGVVAALPLLDAMVPAMTAMSKTAANPVPRLAVWGHANGVFGPHFKPKGTGTSLAKGAGIELPIILQPLEGLRDYTLVPIGLSNVAANDRQVGSGAHARAAGAYLSGCAPVRTEGADIACGTTLDQHAAKMLGKDTQLESLELALESSLSGNCDQGYSCVYINTFSWRTPTMPMPMENNPRAVFERMFGDGGSVEQRVGQLRAERSILDAVADDLQGLQKNLGSSDRNTVSGYLEAVRDVERRIQKAERQSATTPLPESAQPAGVPDSFPEHAKLMHDLMFLAFQSDVTRVITFQTSREQGSRVFPFIGVPESHHETSHHQGDPHKITQNSKINAYFVKLYADLAEKMRVTPDGDGSLLDHAAMVWGCPLGSGDIHSPHDMPIVVVGKACGQLKTGRVLRYPLDTPMMNFGLALLEKLGVHLDRIGDSTGHLVDL